MDYQVKPLDAAQLETLIRQAQLERDRQLKALIVRGFRAIGRFARIVRTSIAAAYDAERVRTATHAGVAVRKWASRY